ncbi:MULTISPECIES: glutamine--fructose-6-phosphate transaminase (isomerizing) [unclassified Pseudofrankia]|uniref:glutamine--fructose-6-phosphate transaminase (isomerizing) n=1 Tax=unclassified Pseudofrankia TaxID=2994372 RepID=UPI0008D96C5A|nr:MULTISPECIES: glutamine--fructose-6-phosphate transaminase (isomerizing) [unclassified Pseudofrankia]MDT3438521.1 glutamine--fructose-6-phosphate transaminase (isomerizing) [Pseudofrankia sp. BMG5.37]OHV49779.1 glutamine--fructose-6-phosphate aminotransferase [Pseudofrankia sp. BMG5.36]
MCGIIGYVGEQSALEVALGGLRRLEYRGYDSAGIAVVGAGALRVVRRAGKLANLEKALAESDDGAVVGDSMAGTTGMGHTRWATHGGPTDVNAHPHTDCTGAIGVIHNGIIENFTALRAELFAAGHELVSETDTEVVAHLLEAELGRPGSGETNLAASAGRLAIGQSARGSNGMAAAAEGADGGRHPLTEAVRRVCQRLSGAFTLVVLHRDFPDVVVGARRNSPLVIGLGEGETFLASDVSAFIAHTRDALEIGQDQIVEARRDGVSVIDFSGELVEGRPYHVDWDASAAEKGGYPYFMLKEISEQPAVLADTLRGRLSPDGAIVLDEERLSGEDFRDIDKVFIVACGTAYHAGLIAKYAIEHWTRLPCEVEMASEFRYRDPVLDRSTLVVAISQSGETLDTLMAVKHAREQKARVLAICNTNGSTIPRESDAVLYTRCGPEVGVAATKTFLGQVAACLLVGLYLAQARGVLYGDEVGAYVEKLQKMPDLVARTLSTVGPVRELARSLAGAKAVLFLGRHVGYPVALEGALKLKELAYMHAEGFPAGELKHGPIALVEQGVPVVVVVPSPRGRAVLHDKIVSNIQEVRARGARMIVIAEEGDHQVEPFADHLIRVPATPSLFAPLVTTIPLQVFACELALARGLDVDQPRNLAKSVTVE